MKTTKILFNFIVLLLATCTLVAQQSGEEQAILQAKGLVAQGVNRADRDSFVQAQSLLQLLTNDNRFSALAHYYLGYVDYQMGVVIERMDKDKADDYLDSAIEHLEAATQKDKTFAEAYALLASCYGIKISFAPLKGIILGPQSGIAIGKALELAPENPRVALLDAIGIYNRPAMFGGGKEKGLEAMKKAAELFERWKVSDPLQPSWGKEEVYAWIGVAHTGRKEIMLAKKAFEKALEINPEFGWVKNYLLPRLSEQAATKE